jgi:hypothetical protein
MAVKDETRYKRKVRDNYLKAGHWSEAYEPAKGSGTGYPDIQLLSPQKVLLPAELKVGEIKNGRVHPRDVRGDQVVWAHNFRRFGGTSIMMIGVESSKNSNIWDTYVVAGGAMIDWKAGYDFEQCLFLESTSPHDLVRMVQHFLLESTLQPLARALGHVI